MDFRIGTWKPPENVESLDLYPHNALAQIGADSVAYLRSDGSPDEPFQQNGQHDIQHVLLDLLWVTAYDTLDGQVHVQFDRPAVPKAGRFPVGRRRTPSGLETPAKVVAATH
jgi:hypothetical protein